MPIRSYKHERHPEAYTAVNQALASGRLIKSDKCEKCGTKSNDLEAHHHHGYDDAHLLDVQWLCPPCHGKTRRIKDKTHRGRQIYVDLTDYEWQQVRVLAISRGITATDLVAECVRHTLFEGTPTIFTEGIDKHDGHE